VLQHFYKLLPPRKWRIPLAGLVFILGVVANQAKPVLSNQIKRIQGAKALATGFEVPMGRSINPSTNAILPQLREIQTQRNQMENNIPTESWDKTGKFGQSNLKTLPTATALVPGSNGSATRAGVAPKANLPAKDGVYLYGQSTQPEQSGQGYIHAQF
jgi:hypothetical protein